MSLPSFIEYYGILFYVPSGITFGLPTYLEHARRSLLLWLRATYLLVPWSSFIEYSFCLEHAVYFTVLGSLEANAPVAAKPSQNELHFVPWTSFILGRN